MSSTPVSEVVALRLADLDLKAGTMYCRRRKGSRSSVHPTKKDEVEAVERFNGVW